MFEVPSASDRPRKQISRKALAEVVEARYDELFRLVQAELRRSGLEALIPAGIVLTGGASKVPGAIELAESIFNMPVRIGVPQHIRGLKDVVTNPIYSTGVGLLLYAHHQEQEGRDESKFLHDGVKGVWSRMRHWFQGNF